MKNVTNGKTNELPILLFERQAEWAAWLAEYHATAPGLWLRLAKKAAGLNTITYGEALEEALCYGWIDDQKKSYDDQSWLQKFTPRGPRSIWSKINREKAEQLVESGHVKPAGLAAIERARQNGNWEAAYDSATTATVPDDFQAELDKNPEAAAFFATLNGTNRYAILFRIQTAKKAETRAKRIQQFIDLSARGEKLYP